LSAWQGESSFKPDTTATFPDIVLLHELLQLCAYCNAIPKARKACQGFTFEQQISAKRTTDRQHQLAATALMWSWLTFQ